jgi:hypothetical protein
MNCIQKAHSLRSGGVGQLTRYTRVYTTVRDGQMLSLVFSANSSDALNSVVESMDAFGLLEYK